MAAAEAPPTVTAAPAGLPLDVRLQPETGAFLSLDIRVYLPGYEDLARTVRRELQLSFREAISPTAKEILDAVADTEGLSAEGRKLFALWATNGVLELQIRPRSTLAYIINRWPRWVEKYTHDSEAVARSVQLEVRREALLTKAQERKVVEEACLRLLYSEARDKVLAGGYPCSAEDATTLCAYTLQASFGDCDPAKPAAKENIMRNIPAVLQKEMRQPDWESAVMSEYAKLKGRPQLIAHMLYLQYVRQWVVYGSVFYSACKNVPPNGFFELRSDKKLIGINPDGIVVVDQDKHKIIFSEPFTRMAWLYSEDTVTFEYGSVTNPQSLTLITPQAHLVDRLAVEAVRRIERQDKQIKRLRAKQAEESSGNPSSQGLC